MISVSKSERIKTLLAELQISPTDYPAMIVAYKILRHLATACLVIDEASVRQAINDSSYQRALAKYPLHISSSFDITQATTIMRLCQIFRDAGWHSSYTDFFLALCPAMAADWVAVRALDGKSFSVLDALYGILTVQLATGVEKMWFQDPHDYFSATRQYCPMLPLAAYDKIWSAVRGFDLTTTNLVDDSELVEQAIAQYAMRSASKKDLLRDYLHMFPDHSQTPMRFDQLDKKVQQHVQVVAPPKTDVSSNCDREDYFTVPQRVAANTLPSRVLTRLLYRKTSDSKFDSTIALKAFTNRIYTAQNPVVLNPSPAFLEAWTSAEPALPAITVVVPSRQIGLALSQEYKSLSFYSVSEARKTPLQTDLVLTFGEETSKTEQPDIVTLLSCVELTDNCEAIFRLPERALTQKTTLVGDLAKKNLTARRILQIPNGLCVSNKKALLIAAKNSNDDANTAASLCEVLKLVAVKGETDSLVGAYFSPDVLNLSTAGLCTGKKLSTLIADYIAVPPEPKGVPRNAAKPVRWSKDVTLCVTECCHPDGFRAKVYVQKAPRTEGGKPGTSLFGEIGEADLRAKNETALMKKIMQVPLRDQYCSIIAKDLEKAYRGRSEGLSLKTIWLILRTKSRPIRGREEEAIKLFCGEDQSLANLTFGASYDELRVALQSVLQSKLVAKRYWLFLKMLANQATKHHLITRNPLEKIWTKVESEDNRIIYEIQEALRDWSFSQPEMDRMVMPLLEPILVKQKHAYQHVVDSHVLAKLFVLFAMIHKNELCALDFGDITFLPNGDAQVLVTKYIDENGKVKPYNEGGRHRLLRRKTVLTHLLAVCFQHRKAHVASLLSLSEHDLSDVPVFWESEALKKSKIRRLTMKTASKLYDQLLDSSNRQEIDAEQGSSLAVNDGDIVRYVDIGVSRKTEFVFLNSLRIWAEAVCGCENGEITFNAATEAAATIDRFYIGWDAAYNQVATAGKLDRLTSRYMAVLFPRHANTQKRTVTIMESSHTESWTPPADKLGRLRLEIPLNPKAELRLKVETRYGHQVITTIYEEEK